MFEYHPTTGKVYMIDPTRMNADGKHIAEVIAEHCDTDGRAFGFVQTYCRGYRAGRTSTPVIEVRT